MRITYNFMTMKYLNGVNSTLNNLVRASEQVSKGRNLLDPEDDPVNYLTAFNLQRSIDDATQYSRNANSALIWITNEDNELQTASSILSRAKDELAVAGMNDSQDADSRKALAGEVLSIYEEMVNIANAEYLDRYIFGGYETGTEPFTSGDRQVSSVMANMDGAEAFTSRLYGDMPDLAEGTYTLQAIAVGGVVYVSMTDSLSKTVILDSNGSDETTENGNLTSDVLTTEFVPGQVISTGRGVGIKLPDDMQNGDTLSISFHYTPGDDIQYVGDDGEIKTQIGANQNVTLNISGQDIFMETYRTIQGTMSNTSNGVAMSETTFFSNLDGSNISLSDSITFTGTDHNGYKIGTARVTSPANVEFDMTTATEDQRTVTLTYGGKDYDLTMDQEGYGDVSEVIFNLNRMLEREGLGGEITAINDGDKVMFMTTRAGSGVELTVTGSEYNTLGFISTPVSDRGSDTTFELSYDNYQGPVENTHSGLDISAGTHTYYVNGEEIEITVTAADDEDTIEDKINAALADAGMGFDVDADVSLESGTSYTLKFSLVNQNYTKDTYLATRDDSGSASAYQFSNAKGSDYPIADENRVSDMLDFIEDLYDNAVSATLVDGKIQVQDLRSGSSRLTFSMDEDNTGVGYPMLDPNITTVGRYTGTGDDVWSVDVTVSATITLMVTDQNGNIIVDNSSNPIVTADYNGDDIYLKSGVSIVLGEITSSTSFSMDMTSFANLSFGDLNVIEEGENVDVFRSLKNLYEALDKNIPDSGIAAPSAWRDESLNSTAVPYMDGTFRGNYNDELTFEVEYYNDESEFYIQTEQYWESEAVLSIPDADVDITIVLDSDDSGVLTRNYSLPSASYSANGTILINNLVSLINSDTTLREMGVQAYNDEGQLRIDSGSGNTEISVQYNDVETAMVFGQVGQTDSGTQLPIMGLNDPVELDVIFHTSTGWVTDQFITVPAATYAGTDELLLAINGELDNLMIANGLLPGSITATLNANGTIKFNASIDVDDIVVSGDENGTLGIYNTVNDDTLISKIMPTLDVSEKDVISRTITFDYYDIASSGLETASIVVDKENFQTLEDLITNINGQLTDAGLNGISCVQVGEGQIGFHYDDTDISYLHVSGDYEGTFGFERGGDVAKLKVTGSDGTLIASYEIDTANESYFIGDGMYQHYDEGYIYATDSYSVAVGSGISYEMGVLEQAESQIHTALTTVGNRQNRAESAISFNDALITMNEEIKADYTESSLLDQAKATTNYTVSQTVYQAALQTTATILQISLLDYL